jgi:hypothetical protein
VGEKWLQHGLALDISPLRHISNKARDMVGHTRMLFPLPVVHLTDNQTLADMINGRAALPREPDVCWAIKSLRWSAHVLQYAWCFKTSIGQHGLAQFVTRDMNQAADAWANFALRNGDYEDMSMFPLASDCAIVLCTDGACPGNPGRGAAAACVFVLFQNLLFPVAVHCVQLGLTTSFRAEAEAACLGHSLLARWCVSNGLCRSG